MAHILHNSITQTELIYHDLEPIINHSIDNDELDRLILIFPTGRLVRLYSRKIIRQYYNKHNKPCEKPKIFTIHSFVKYCLESVLDHHKYKIISDYYKVYLFEEAAKNANFNFYSNKNISSAIIKKMSNIISGLKSEGIYIENIQEEINSESISDNIFDINRYSDIYKLYSEYEKLLGNRLIAQNDLIRLFNEYFRTIYNSHPYVDLSKTEQIENHPLNKLFSCDSVIVLSGFSQFRIPEIEFISHFAISLIPFIIYIDFSNQNGPLFGNLIDTINKLEIAGFRNIDLEKVYIQKFVNTKSTYIRRWLFNTEQRLENDSFINQIKIFAVNNKTEEVFSIARLIRWYNLKKNVPLNEICVVMRQPELYTNIFRDIFRISAIPANITDRFNLAMSPISVAIFNVLELILYRFGRENLKKSLKSKYLSFDSPDGRTIDPNRIYSIALELKISDTYGLGLDFWEKRIQNRIQFFENLISNYQDDDEYLFYDLKLRIELLTNASKDIQILKSIFIEPPQKLSPNQFRNYILENIIYKLKIKENILELFKKTRNNTEISPIELIFIEDEIEKESRALSLLTELLNEMTTILTERYPNENFSLKELVSQYKTIVSTGKYQIREKYQFGVDITSIEQSRGIPYKVIILCGACDNQFPLPYRTETILGKELMKSEAKHYEAERMLFYQFLTNNPKLLDYDEQDIYIFYPKNDGENELIRSRFVNELLKILSPNEEKYVFDIDFLRKSGNLTKEHIWINSLINPSDFLSNIDRLSNNEIKPQALADFRFKRMYKEIDNIRPFVINLHNQLRNIKETFDIKKIREEEKAYLSSKKDKPFSATELEIYAKCPYKFFINRILGIQPEISPELQLTRLEQGNIIHNILYKFYRALQNEVISQNNFETIKSKNNNLPELIPIKLESNYLAHYKTLLNEIAEQELEKFQFDNLFFEINRAELIGNEENPGLIYIWFSNEINRIHNGWNFQPILFEFFFGKSNSSNDNFELIKITEDLKISGKIDRVEINLNNEKPEFIICDYKITYSNTLPSDNDIRQGQSFQMPFYIFAMQKILKEQYNIDAEIGGGVYYPIKPGYDKTKKQIITEKFVLVSDKSSLNKFTNRSINLDLHLQSSIEHANKFVNEICQGKFFVLPVNSRVCNYCTFGNICRIDDTR